MARIQNYFNLNNEKWKAIIVLYSNSEEISVSEQPRAVWEHQEDDMGTL